MPHPIPDNDERRIKALAEYQLLDTLAEQEYDDAVRMAANICQAQYAAIAPPDPERAWTDTAAPLPMDPGCRAVAICAQKLMAEQPLVVADIARDSRFAEIDAAAASPCPRFYAGVPLIHPEGHPLGVLCALGNRPQQLTEQQLSDLEALARFVVSLFELRRSLLRQQLKNQLLRSYQQKISKLNDELQALNLTDELTGLYNRRAFNRELQRETAHYKRHRTPLSLLMLDIDRFKAFNDQLGQVAGDDALRHLAFILADTTRKTDILARYGGEEFAIIMPKTQRTPPTMWRSGFAPKLSCAPASTAASPSASGSAPPIPTSPTRSSWSNWPTRRSTKPNARAATTSVTTDRRPPRSRLFFLDL